MMNRLFILLFICCGITVSSDTRAETALYFQNNTSLPFSVQVSQTGGSLSTSNWGTSTNNVQPWQLNSQLMWTNRDQGISNGVDFFFDVILSNGGQSVVLKLKINGNFVGSDLWQSASGPGFAHSWFSDRSFHDATFNFQGRIFTLKYHAYFTGGDDDLLYVLQEQNPFPVDAADLANPNAINILSYNIYMLPPPIAYTDQTERALAMAAEVSGYDVIIFSEAFYNTAREDYLLPSISVEYPHHTPVVDQSGATEDGGVFIASRWAIDTVAWSVYTDCDGSDCMSAKGVMYARIDKLGKKYHIFGTHTQAWPDPIDVTTRILQFQQLMAFKQSLNIPEGEPVLIGGDLNVDKITNNMGEYDGMLDTLDAIEPTYLGHPHTYDIQYSHYTSGTVSEYLDYVLPIRGHHSPHLITNEPIILRSIADDMWDMFDLSDHFAVKARAEYPVITLQPVAQALCEGDVLTLHVAFSIAATYQWYANGQPINGATAATYTVSGATAADAGNYHCVITYNNGVMTTDAAVVAVQHIPQPIISQSQDTLYAGNGGGTNQWYDANGQVVGSGDFFVPTTSGIYTVQTLDGGCMSEMSAPVSFVIVGIASAADIGFSLYPTPVRDQLILDWRDGGVPLSYRLYNHLGQLITTAAAVAAPHRIAVESLPAGVYVLEWEMGTRQDRHKVVIVR